MRGDRVGVAGGGESLVRSLAGTGHTTEVRKTAFDEYSDIACTDIPPTRKVFQVANSSHLQGTTDTTHLIASTPAMPPGASYP